MSRHIVCLTFDFDTMSAYIARGMTGPTPLSEGEFGIRGAERLCALMRSHGIRATWFVPGFTLETYPDICAAIAAEGHEIGHHGWNHHPPATLTRDEEERELARANEAIERVSGRRARGYRSPSWDLSAHTVDLLIAHGFVYDSSMMGDDYSPYRIRRGDLASLDAPYQFGVETQLIEMPISWSLDDAPHFKFSGSTSTVTQGLRSPRTVLASWFDDFVYLRKSLDWGVMTITMHPHVIGRGHRLIWLEDLVSRLARGGATFLTMEEAALEAASQIIAPQRT